MRLFKRKAVKVAVAQMPIVHGDRDTNLRTADRFIRESSSHNAGLICLPQAFATGLNLPELRSSAEPVPDGPTTRFLAESAVRSQAYIIAGILESDGRDVYDTAVLIDPSGRLAGKYRRWFLWQMEKQFFTPGSPVGCFKTSIGRIGLIIGYDVNFPEACRHYFRDQVDVIVCIADVMDDIGFPVLHLSRARAIENHCYFVFCSALGEHAFTGTSFMGRSAIACDPIFLVYELKEDRVPEPGILKQADRAPQVITAELCLEDLAARRSRVPEYSDLLDATTLTGGDRSWLIG